MGNAQPTPDNYKLITCHSLFLNLYFPHFTAIEFIDRFEAFHR